MLYLQLFESLGIFLCVLGCKLQRTTRFCALYSQHPRTSSIFRIIAIALFEACQVAIMCLARSASSCKIIIPSRQTRLCHRSVLLMQQAEMPNVLLVCPNVCVCNIMYVKIIIITCYTCISGFSSKPYEHE